MKSALVYTNGSYKEIKVGQVWMLPRDLWEDRKRTSGTVWILICKIYKGKHRFEVDILFSSYPHKNDGRLKLNTLERWESACSFLCNWELLNEEEK